VALRIAILSVRIGVHLWLICLCISPRPLLLCGDLSCRARVESGVARATLKDLARVKDAVAAVPGKLAKQSLLAEYFRALEDSDLRLAVRFSAGRTFAATD